MKKEVLIVLGAPNSPSGELSDISKSRLDCCFRQYSKGKLVLCTGGWGIHFNTSEDAHAAHAKKYLIGKGVLEHDFLPFALSSNTVEDAVKVKKIISELVDIHLKVITSSYHMKRVKLIFQDVLKKYSIYYKVAECDLDKNLLQQLIDHEQKAIRAIIENGVY